MSTTYYNFRGIASWAKVFDFNGDQEYERWKINIALDDVSLEKFKNSGLSGEIKNNNEVTFGRRFTQQILGKMVEFDPPKVTNASGKPFDPETNGLIGNGSEVIANVAVYDLFKGKVKKGHRLEGVKVINQVVYHKPDDSEQSENPDIDMSLRHEPEEEPKTAKKARPF